MIEKRTMAVVESSHNVRPIMAMYDTDKNVLVCYKYLDDEGEEEDPDGDWYHNYKNEHYFNTLQEAKDWVEQRQEYLRQKMTEVREFINEMDDIDQDIFKFEKSEYLGSYASADDSYYRKEYNKARKKSSLFSSIARSRHFNINGRTINIDDVVRVEWNDNDKATLATRDGTKVKSNTDIEYEIITEMFGSNRSGMEMRSY